MKKFIGKVFTLIGGLGLIILSLVGVGFILYDLITYKLSILTETVYFNGWIALLTTLFFIFTNFFISFIALKNISINKSNKKVLVGIFITLFLYIAYVLYIMIVINDFLNKNIFINIFILNFVFNFIFIFGILLDLNN